MVYGVGYCFIVSVMVKDLGKVVIFEVDLFCFVGSLGCDIDCCSLDYDYDCCSIVVLLFVNMSGDLENEYFSDGIVEEIFSLLIKLL